MNNVAKSKGIPSQLVFQNYMMERLLDRISRSKYKNNFILKGGFLISAIVGIDMRTTMDIDTTIKGFDLTHESMRTIITEICKISASDDFSFSLDRITDIRDTDDYPGIRVFLIAEYASIKGWLTVDVTTGDVITPKEVNFGIQTMFDEGEIPILAYSIETIIAEKLETVISRSVANTRPRDYYDIYLLVTTHREMIDIAVLRRALIATSEKRGSIAQIERWDSILTTIMVDRDMDARWEKYRKSYSYAKDISFMNVCDTARDILTRIFFEE
jgi:predicted nucleotidyltransferase component of viral defense system